MELSRRPYWVMILCVLVNLMSSVGSAQILRGDAARVFDLVLKDSRSSIVPFIPFTPEYSKTPLFQPDDITPVMRSEIHLNQFVRTSKGFFVAIEGTGRVYRILPDASGGYEFMRIDSTHHVGYNFGAQVFAFRDTIFSMGGYGFWQQNGQVRYFRPDVYGWEIVQTNRRVQVRGPARGFFLDTASASVWYVNHSNHYEDIAPDFKKDFPKEEQTVFRFDLNAKIWEVMGRATPEFAAIAFEPSVIGLTPNGTVNLIGTPQNPRLLLIDYSANSVLEYKNTQTVRRIQASTKSRNNEPHTIITWFSNDTLTVVNNGFITNTFHLPVTRFEDINMRIYTPAERSSVFTDPGRWNWSVWMALGFIPGIAAGWIVLLRRDRKRNPDDSEQEVFTVWEKRVLQAFQSKPGFILTVDEMDEILQTSARSKDIQNQKRSSVTRSINHKYNLLSGDSESLIETRRQEFDRRMFSYYLSEEKFAAIKEKLGKEAEG